VRIREQPAGDGVEVTVSGFFTTHHFVQTSTGILGELTLPAFSTGGVFYAADGRELVVRRTIWWRGWHEMREDGVVVGTAHSQGFWRRTMNVGFRGATYELVPTDCWSREWCLLDETGATVIAVRSRGAFRRGAYLTVVEPVHVDLLAFVYYLVNVRWQEQSAAAGAAAGS
jgi:hypothetical protein